MTLVYATVADMAALCGERELQDLRPHPGPSGWDADAVQRAIDAAQAVADSYVGQVYLLPMRGCERTVNGVLELAPPPLLNVAVLDIARFMLHRDLTDTHEVYRRHKQARVDLEAVARGERALVCPWGGGAPSSTLEGAKAAQQNAGGADSYVGDYVDVLDDKLKGFA